MTLKELKNILITKALEKTKGNAKKAAKLLDVSCRTIYSFKAKQLKQK
tara:strand:+ start:218 stop:361 length:144 start_codon:yes stop_codon:yes gene_type:complete